MGARMSELNKNVRKDGNAFSYSNKHLCACVRKRKPSDVRILSPYMEQGLSYCHTDPEVSVVESEKSNISTFLGK